MTLGRGVLITSLLIALPSAAGLAVAVNRLRADDARLALERAADAWLTQHTREQCEGDPNWFLAGPRENPPTKEERAQPDADVKLPRPGTGELPLEFYAYDDDFTAGSTAAPRLPPEFRRAFQSSPPADRTVGSFETSAGAGVQLARRTGWTPGPCAFVLFRLRPAPHQRTQELEWFLALAGVCFGIALAGVAPTFLRVTRLARAVRASAADQYRGIAPVSGRDEIGLLGATFNDAAAELRRRGTDIHDREDALRRYVTTMGEDVAAPLADLADRLGALGGAGDLGAEVRHDLGQVVRDAHALAMRLRNLEAAAALRTPRERAAREAVNLNDLAARVVLAQTPLARALGVSPRADLPDAPVVVSGNQRLLEQALSNLVDNAIRYNRPGGHVVVSLARRGADHFLLRVTDDGPGVTEEHLKGLAAIRRFRGDEGRARQPGAPGLGLAVAREVAERFDLQMTLRRPAAGGLEVEISGPTETGTSAPTTA